MSLLSLNFSPPTDRGLSRMRALLSTPAAESDRLIDYRRVALGSTRSSRATRSSRGSHDSACSYNEDDTPMGAATAVLCTRRCVCAIAFGLAIVVLALVVAVVQLQLEVFGVRTQRDQALARGEALQALLMRTHTRPPNGPPPAHGVIYPPGVVALRHVRQAPPQTSPPLPLLNHQQQPSTAPLPPAPLQRPQAGAWPVAASTPPPCAAVSAPQVAHVAAADGVGGAMPPVRTLFIGNSYVRFNDLAGLYRALVSTARPGLSVEVQTVAPDGKDLAWHAARKPWVTFPHRKWTHVVLQEQSQVAGHTLEPPIPQIFNASLEACFALAASARRLGAHTIVLMQTWGYRDGDKLNPDHFPDFVSMQQRLNGGYDALLAQARRASAEVARSGAAAEHMHLRAGQAPSRGGAAVDVLLAPVGRAFARLHAQSTARHGEGFRELYDPDGMHPSLEGSYLAACVLAAQLHGLRPSSLSHVPAALKAERASELRATAQSEVDAAQGCADSARS